MIESLTELSMDPKWRTKLSVIQTFIELATQLGQAFFNAHLSGICAAWLSDKVCMIREQAIEVYRQLSEVFGAQWASQHAVPHFIALQADESYLKRKIALMGVAALAPPLVNLETVRTQYMPALRNLAQDRVANIRVSTAKSL